MTESNTPLKKLELSLGEQSMKAYLHLLRQWYSLSPTLTKIDFEIALRKILTTEEQYCYHRDIIWGNLMPKYYAVKPKPSTSTTDKGVFEMADYADYIPTFSPDGEPPAELEYRSAASELFVPDNNFIKARLAIFSWENKLQIPEENVIDLIVHSTRVFVKNIITAMISRKTSYKLRDGKLQYGFGLPVPDPSIQNSIRIRERLPNRDDEDYVPPSRIPVDVAEQQAAFLYACGRKQLSNGALTLNLLFDVLKDNPRVVGLHSIHSVQLFKVGLLLGEE